MTALKRLIAPSDQMREVEIAGVRTGRSTVYKWQKDGTVHVRSAEHERLLKQAGFTEAGLTRATMSSGGFICSECGFHSWFRKCSRCGGEGMKV